MHGRVPAPRQMIRVDRRREIPIAAACSSPLKVLIRARCGSARRPDELVAATRRLPCLVLVPGGPPLIATRAESFLRRGLWQMPLRAQTCPRSLLCPAPRRRRRRALSSPARKQRRGNSRGHSVRNHDVARTLPRPLPRGGPRAAAWAGVLPAVLARARSGGLLRDSHDGDGCLIGGASAARAASNSSQGDGCLPDGGASAARARADGEMLRSEDEARGQPQEAPQARALLRRRRTAS